jgi:hypothetical protein
MKRRAVTILLTLAGIALIAVAAPAAVAQAAVSNTTIAVHVDFAGTSSWSSAGAFADEGWVAPLSQRFGSPFGPSPEWTAHEEILFVGRAGSFTIRQQALMVDMSPVLSTGTSHWVVWSGTGTYAGLRGHGTAAVEVHWDVGTLDVAVVGTFDLHDPMR